MSVILWILSFWTALLFVIYLVSKRKYDYWKKRKVPYLKPLPILGNYGEFILLKKYNGQLLQTLCQKLPNEPYFGAFFGTEPVLIVKDPEILKLIMTKDFYYFNGREVSQHTHKETITQNLFFTYGDRWRLTRQLWTPLFTSLKMKNMFHLIEKRCVDFEKILKEESNKPREVDMKTLMVRYTMDSVCACAFGIDTNTLISSDFDNNPFRIMGNSMFEVSLLSGFKNMARSIWPTIFYASNLRMFPKAIDNFFGKLMSNVFAERCNQISTRNDFVDLVMAHKNNKYLEGDSINNMKPGSEPKKSKIDVTEQFIIAQCVTFFAAGFETSSMTATFTLYELARNQEAQAKVLEEVDKYWTTHTKVEYDCVTSLPYLDACIDEALRLHPVLGILTREVMDEYQLPTGLVLKKGDRVHIPLYHMHRDPKYFSEPLKFRPERFYGEEKRNIIPYTYFPFGEGPRTCIGMRFAKMQILAVLATFFKSFQVQTCSKTPKIMDYEPKVIVTQPKSKIILKLVPRQ